MQPMKRRTNIAALILGVAGLMAVPSTAALAQDRPDSAEFGALLDEGEALYDRHCATCHGDEGEGGEGPALADNQRLEFISAIATQVLFGGAYMPAFDQLSNQEVAAVATYIRNSFGNEFGIVVEEDVATYRE